MSFINWLYIHVEHNTLVCQKGFVQLFSFFIILDDELSKHIPPDDMEKVIHHISQHSLQNLSLISRHPIMQATRSRESSSFINLSYQQVGGQNGTWSGTIGTSPCERKPLEDLRELINEEFRSVAICGGAGKGKTTVMKQLVCKISSDPQLKNKFRLPIFLPLCGARGQQCIAESIFHYNMLKEHFLGYDYKELRMKILEFLKNNQGSTIYFLDGFDEMYVEQLAEPTEHITLMDVIKRKAFQNSKMYVSMRPHTKHLLPNLDTIVDVLGFSEEQVKQYIISNLGQNYLDNIMQQLKRIDMVDLSKTPLILKMICFIYEKEKVLPDSITKLYKKSINLLYTHAMSRLDMIISDTGHTRESVESIIMKLGQIAWEGLLKQKLRFKKHKLEMKYPQDRYWIDICVNIGVMIAETWFNSVEMVTESILFFYHKTVQEYCAGFYIAKEINKDINKWYSYLGHLSSLAAILDMGKVIQFTIGSFDKRTAPKATSVLFDHMLSVVLLKLKSDPSESAELLKDSGLVRQISRLQKACNKEAQGLFESLVPVYFVYVDHSFGCRITPTVLMHSPDYKLESDGCVLLSAVCEHYVYITPDLSLCQYVDPNIHIPKSMTLCGDLDDDITTVLPLIQYLPIQTNRVVFSGLRITQECGQEMKDAVAPLTKLKLLWFVDCDISNGGFSAVCMAASAVPWIDWLLVAGCTMGAFCDEDIEHLVSCLDQLKNMTKLNLDNDWSHCLKSENNKIRQLVKEKKPRLKLWL